MFHEVIQKIARFLKHIVLSIGLLSRFEVDTLTVCAGCSESGRGNASNERPTTQLSRYQITLWHRDDRHLHDLQQNSSPTDPS